MQSPASEEAADKDDTTLDRPGANSETQSHARDPKIVDSETLDSVQLSFLLTRLRSNPGHALRQGSEV